MSILRKNARLVLVAVGAVTALAAIVVTLTAAASTPPPPMLNSVSAADLANAGIQLGAPVASATVSQAAAQQTALQQFPGSTVRETVLADFSKTDNVPALNTTAWAVSLTVPPGLTPQGPIGPKATFTYLVVFIDATTGQFIMSTSGGKMPSLWPNNCCHSQV